VVFRSLSLCDCSLLHEGLRKEAGSFTYEEVGKILSAAPKPFDTILAVTAVLGLRIGEVLALRVGDIDLTKSGFANVSKLTMANRGCPS